MKERMVCDICASRNKCPMDVKPYTDACSGVQSSISVNPEHKTQGDVVNHPPHYTQGGIECIDAMESAVTGLTGMDAVYTAQVIKYMWRWKKKNGIEDLKKAQWYLGRLIKKIGSDT